VLKPEFQHTAFNFWFQIQLAPLQLGGIPNGADGTAGIADADGSGKGNGNGNGDATLLEAWEAWEQRKRLASLSLPTWQQHDVVDVAAAVAAAGGDW
jgi:hypothetical protein